MENIPVTTNQINHQQPLESKRMTAGILGLLFGSLGLHKFYLGYTVPGVIHILVTTFTCGGFALIGFIEGIIYLTKSDEEFIQTYQVNKKEWF